MCVCVCVCVCNHSYSLFPTPPHPFFFFSSSHDVFLIRHSHFILGLDVSYVVNPPPPNTHPFIFSKCLFSCSLFLLSFSFFNPSSALTSVFLSLHYMMKTTQNVLSLLFLFFSITMSCLPFVSVFSLFFACIRFV